MAPEVLLCAESAIFERSVYAIYSKAIDWWSMGATVYEAAVGRPPFWTPTIAETYHRIRNIDWDLMATHRLSPTLMSLISG
jgi:serum/glucocorticoid-regulated kinase 2